MSTTEQTNTQLTKKGHPKGLYMLFMVEMWERFNFYGMRALLTLFMVSSVIGFSEPTAFKIYGWFSALVYFTPIIGGYLADQYIGRRHAITIGALLMITGQFTLASYGFLPAKAALFTGLSFIIIGNGFLKPNISTIVGELYGPNDPRRDSGFTIFYMGINLGAFIAPFVTGFVGEQTATSPAWVQWRYGFMTAGAGMIIGLVWYLLAQRKYLGDIGMRPVSKAVNQNTLQANAKLNKEEKERILAIFVITFFAIFFYAFFEQAGSSLSIFARDSINRVITLPFTNTLYEVRASWFQAVNPICVILLAPLFAKLWLALAAKNKEPSTPFKFGSGLFLLGCGYLVLVLGVSYLSAGKINMLWLIALFFLHTCGELCISPVGLSMISKLAPLKYTSLFMGVWFTANFFGNLLAGYFATLSKVLSLSQFFLMPAICSIICAAVIWAMSKHIKKWMHGVQQ